VKLGFMILGLFQLIGDFLFWGVDGRMVLDCVLCGCCFDEYMCVGDFG
jgi:hypothetical protein